MQRLRGLDAYLTPRDPVEIELSDVECAECGIEQDVTAFVDGDEANWNCPDCGHGNTTYWDDDPAGMRGWVR